MDALHLLQAALGGLELAPQFIPKTWTIANYVAVFKTAPFIRFFANSLLSSRSSRRPSILISSTLAGYVFGKFDFPFKKPSLHSHSRHGHGTLRDLL
jgi:multiple sugar transport system permease protein